MEILAIETSCDETAISLIEVKKDKKGHTFKILGNEVSSQIEIHKEYGGVYPMMAKREHSKNIISVLEKVLKEAKYYKLRITNYQLPIKTKNKIQKILERENDLPRDFINALVKIKKPKIDAIAVTTGPGLEPALWVGISFTKALSLLWDIPIIPVNHMEGHIFSIFPKKGKTFHIENKKELFPMLSLLVSGGHTELVLSKDWQNYKKIGATRDDAVGEAFDKVARMLGLPYPGGPAISSLAQSAREDELQINNSSESKMSDFSWSGPSSSLVRGPEKSNILLKPIILPRPMMYSKDYDFSFSGLKTAVLYTIRDIGKLTEDTKKQIAKEFEDAVVETLTHKTMNAIKEYKIKTLIVGGGVSANSYLQKIIKEKIKENNLSKARPCPKTKVYFPSSKLTGDNALMIAIAGYFQYQNKKYTKNLNSIKAKGNLSL